MSAISKLQFGSNLRPSLVSVMNKMNDVIDTVNATTQQTDIDKVDGKHLWSGTQAEYDALTVKDVNTLYFVSAS